MSHSGRKRCRDPLGERLHENRYKAKSQIKNTFLGGSLSLHVSTSAEIHERVVKARMAVAISHGSFFTPQKIHADSASSSRLEMHATPEYFKAHKMAVYYQFLLYGAPEEEQWANVNLINTIMTNLCIPRGNFQRVRKTLLDCLQSIQLNMEYNPLACYENNGAEPKIKDFDGSANVIYTMLQTGMSYPQVTSLVNMARIRSHN